jgi:hypothetical protein
MVDKKSNPEMSVIKGKGTHGYNKNLILLTGIMGIIGSALLGASDLLLLGRPTAGGTAFDIKHMVFVTRWRLIVGVFLGVIIAIPLMITGFYQVLIASRPAGRWWSWPVFLGFTHSMIVGAAFHGSYLFIGTGIKISAALEHTGIEPLVNKVEAFTTYELIFRRIVIIELIVVSVWFVVAVLRNTSLYP